MFKLATKSLLLEFAGERPVHTPSVIELDNRLSDLADAGRTAKAGDCQHGCYGDREPSAQLEEHALDMATGSETSHIGVFVDSVCEVIAIRGEDIEAPPTLGVGDSCDYMLGVAKCESGVKILLEVDHILESSDMASVVQAIESKCEDDPIKNKKVEAEVNDNPLAHPPRRALTKNS